MTFGLGKYLEEFGFGGSRYLDVPLLEAEPIIISYILLHDPAHRYGPRSIHAKLRGNGHHFTPLAIEGLSNSSGWHMIANDDVSVSLMLICGAEPLIEPWFVGPVCDHGCECSHQRSCQSACLDVAIRVTPCLCRRSQQPFDFHSRRGTTCCRGHRESPTDDLGFHVDIRRVRIPGNQPVGRSRTLC